MGGRGDAFSWGHSHVSKGERGVVEDDPFALGRRGIGHSLGELLLLDHSPQGLDRACILLCHSLWGVYNGKVGRRTKSSRQIAQDLIGLILLRV